MARPRKVVDPNLVESLAKIHCTNEEIASIVGVSVDTLTRRFADVIKKGKENGRASLRRMQFEKASKGNATMLIWLGKQLLGQKDRIDTTTGDMPVRFTLNIGESTIKDGTE